MSASKPAPAAKKSEARPQRSKTYRVDRNKVNAILEEAVENPEIGSQQFDQAANTWVRIIESGEADKARHWFAASCSQ